MEYYWFRGWYPCQDFIAEMGDRVQRWSVNMLPNAEFPYVVIVKKEQ